MHTPATLKELHRFIVSLDWEDMMSQVEQETHARLAIVGPVNAVSPISPVPGTTQELVTDWFGPFVLVDTPGFGEAESSSGTKDAEDRAQVALQAINDTAVVVLLLDAAAGLRQSDLELYHELVGTGRPVVVVLNKIDLVGRDRQAVLADAQARLSNAEIIPISAKRGNGVANQLMPAVFGADSRLAVAIGIIGAEPIPGLALPLLLTSHVRMVLRLAAIYGETVSPERARELVATMAGGVALRYAGIVSAKFVRDWSGGHPILRERKAAHPRAAPRPV
jgi:small GTP-binding protein